MSTIPAHLNYIKYKSRQNKVQEKQITPEPKIDLQSMHDFFDRVIECSEDWCVKHQPHDLIVTNENELQFLQKFRELINKQQTDVLGAYLKSLENKLTKK